MGQLFLQNRPNILASARRGRNSSFCFGNSFPSPMKTFFFSRRALCVSSALTLGALSPMLAGCGGGGNGPTVPIPSNTPTPSGTATPQQQFKPNYLQDIPTLRRWRQFPVTISFVRDSNYTSAAQQRALAGFNFWLKRIPNGPTFAVISSSQMSDLTVSFYQFNSASDGVLGTTRVYSSTNPSFIGTISHATMELGITGDNTLDIATAAHEYGHALGILGHSKNPDDLMYFQGNDDRSGQLTAADVNSMLTNYNGVFPKGGNNRLAPVLGPFEVTEIH